MSESRRAGVVTDKFRSADTQRGGDTLVSPPRAAAAGLGALCITSVGEAAGSGLLETGGGALEFRFALDGGVQGGCGGLALGRRPVALGGQLSDQLRTAQGLAARAQHQRRGVQGAELLGGR